MLDIRKLFFSWKKLRGSVAPCLRHLASTSQRAEVLWVLGKHKMVGDLLLSPSSGEDLSGDFDQRVPSA